MSKTKILSFFSAIVLGVAIALPSANAQDEPSPPKMNIGLVDMERIFKEFYKTKIEEQKVEEVKAVIAAEVEKRREKHSSVLAEYEALVKKVRDPTLSDAVRRGHQANAEAKAGELQALDQAMAKYAEDKRRQLLTEVEQRKAEILNEISEKINEMAKAQDFDAVFDRGGLSDRGFPFVVFIKDATDISREVITNLNANAPKGAAPPATTPPKKPTE